MVNIFIIFLYKMFGKIEKEYLIGVIFILSMEL